MALEMGPFAGLFFCEGSTINFTSAPTGPAAGGRRKQGYRGKHRALHGWPFRRRIALTLTLLWVLGQAVVAGQPLDHLTLGLAERTGAGLATFVSPNRSHSSVAKHGGIASGKRSASDHSFREARDPSPVTPGLPPKIGGQEGDHGNQTSQPSVAFSQYFMTTRPSVLDRFGCAEGQRLARSTQSSAIVILAFGRPMRHHGLAGVSLFGRGFASADVVEQAGHAYAAGYVRCSQPDSPRLHLALGTSNFGNGVTFRHGAAWARMVNGANAWALGRGISTRVEFAGADDIELAWNGPVPSKAWVRGYDSEAAWPYYDYGDAAGCPPRGNCLGAWTQEDVWFVAWGARSAWPLPEIYTPTGTMAQEWYRMSLYSYQHHGLRMTLAGALAQYAACRQSSDPCWGMNNSPAKAWRQLNRLINADPRTAQPLRWLSDFRWAAR
jgi:hypothetical protein